MTHSALGAERHLLDPATRADAAALERLLHKDFVEIGRSGRVWSRAQMIEALIGDPGVPGIAEGFAVDELAYGNALVTYTLDGVRRSSIWIRDGGRWQIRFHQGTPITSA